MLALREQRLAAGEEPLGWKVGFGSAASFARLGTDRPLPGFLLRSGQLADGATVDLSNWTNPHLELEVAAYLGEDLAIAGVGSAIELVDTTPVTTDLEVILGGNIYHRHVLLGPVDSGKRDGAGVTARLLKDGEEIARADDPQATTGEIVAVVAGIRELLRRCGADFRPGDVIITGSAFPPVPVGPGAYTTELPPLGSLGVQLTLVSDN